VADRVEILAPAGQWTSLEAAIQSGCDAIYFGVDGLNMRATAQNFSVSELPDIVARCRRDDVRCYLTLNTIVYEGEFDLLDATLDAAAAAGVDAIIASDLAVISSARARGLDVHVSTQLSVSNSRALCVLHRTFGIQRFVLARECSLEDIAQMRKHLKSELGPASETIELEAFAHGAMCVSVSGRCFMSQFQYGKSANRGECLQPCRREYQVTNTEEGQAFDLGAHHVMSPKDLCTLPFVERLVDAGIVSLKIEGRNRSPEYVSAVTRAYREVVDAYIEQGSDKDVAALQALKDEHQARIERVYHRGYASGHFMGQPIDAWTKSGGSQASAKKAYVGLVTNYYGRMGVAEVLIQDHTIACGDTVMFQGPTTGVVEIQIESMQVDHADVSEGSKGQAVAIKVGSRVRRNDKLYVIVDCKPEV
jgi:putative protease